MMTLEELAASNLLVLAETLATAKGVSLAAISGNAHGDSPALGKIKAGTGSMTLRKYDECMAFLRDKKNWPAGTKPPKVWEPWRHSRRNGGANG